MSTNPAALVTVPSDGRATPSPIGGEVTFLARGDQTNGALSAFSVVVPPLEGPPLHVHRNLDEAGYVLEGDFRWRLGDELRATPARSFIFIPRGLEHCFQNIGGGDGKMVVAFAPAGMEGFFERQADLAAFDLDAFRAAAAPEGMEVVGPPACPVGSALGTSGLFLGRAGLSLLVSSGSAEQVARSVVPLPLLPLCESPVSVSRRPA